MFYCFSCFFRVHRSDDFIESTSSLPSHLNDCDSITTYSYLRLLLPEGSAARPRADSEGQAAATISGACSVYLHALMLLQSTMQQLAQVATYLTGEVQIQLQARLRKVFFCWCEIIVVRCF